MLRKNKKHILHIGKYYYPVKGGVERVVQDLAEGSVATTQ